MWCYNYFSLDIQPYDVLIIKVLRDSILSADYALDYSGATSHPCIWDDHEEDLKKFSLLYPDTLFMLTGEGKEDKDLWKLYVKNGKSKKVKAIISFPPVNPSDLV